MMNKLNSCFIGPVYFFISVCVAFGEQLESASAMELKVGDFVVIESECVCHGKTTVKGCVTDLPQEDGNIGLLIDMPYEGSGAKPVTVGTLLLNKNRPVQKYQPSKEFQKEANEYLRIFR